MKILLLENTHSLAFSISNFLTLLEHNVTHFDSKIGLIDIICSGPYDLFLLDLDTANDVSINCIRSITRIFSQTPIILLCNNSHTAAIEKAMNLGCSDYIKRPFEFKELESKIAHIKTNTLPATNTLITLSQNYTYHLHSSSLYYKGKVQIFTKKEKALIALFMLNQNQCITHEQISLTLWNHPYGNFGTVRSNICRLRKKLKENLIETYRDEGYVWTTNHDSH